MTPIRPVSEDHRHEPADYKLEPNELAACPFCGGEASVSSETCGWRVECIERNCYAKGPWPDDCTEAEAIAAWNQRTALTQAPRSCWQPIETAPKNWVPVMVWAISEDERENADDAGVDYVYQAMIARHSDIQPGHWSLCGSSMARVFDPVLWQPLPEPPANQEQQP